MTKTLNVFCVISSQMTCIPTLWSNYITVQQESDLLKRVKMVTRAENYWAMFVHLTLIILSLRTVIMKPNFFCAFEEWFQWTVNRAKLRQGNWLSWGLLGDAECKPTNSLKFYIAFRNSLRPSKILEDCKFRGPFKRQAS